MSARAFFLLFLCFTALCGSVFGIRVSVRCGECSAGSCAYEEFIEDECTEYCDPCTGICRGSYFISSADSTMKTYVNNNCDAQIDTSVNLFCDTCHIYGYTVCSKFYLTCTSYWWVWFFSFVAIFGAIAAVVVLVALFLKKRRNQTALEQGPVEEVSFAQAQYQSSYQQQPQSSY